jgi:hypothetical protein
LLNKVWVAYQGNPANIRKGTPAGGGLQPAVTGYKSLGNGFACISINFVLLQQWNKAGNVKEREILSFFKFHVAWRMISLEIFPKPYTDIDNCRECWNRNELILDGAQQRNVMLRSQLSTEKFPYHSSGC